MAKQTKRFKARTGDVTVPGLTEWDLIYLRALYSGEAEDLTPAEQARRMMPVLREASTGD